MKMDSVWNGAFETLYRRKAAELTASLTTDEGYGNGNKTHCWQGFWRERSILKTSHPWTVWASLSFLNITSGARASEGHQTFGVISTMYTCLNADQKNVRSTTDEISRRRVHYVRNVCRLSINGLWRMDNCGTQCNNHHDRQDKHRSFTQHSRCTHSFCGSESMSSQNYASRNRMCVRDCDLRMLVLWHDGARDFCIIGFRRTLSENQIVYHGPWAVYEACGRKTRYRRSTTFPSLTT
jgi:hypothetical protein